MCHRLLGGLPVIAVVGQGDQEQGAPEDQVGHGDHDEHLDPGDALGLEVPDVGLQLDALGGGDLEEVLAVLGRGVTSRRALAQGPGPLALPSGDQKVASTASAASGQTQISWTNYVQNKYILLKFCSKCL